MKQNMFKVRTDNILSCRLVTQSGRPTFCELRVNGIRNTLDRDYIIKLRFDIGVFDSIFNSFISDVTQGGIDYQITGLWDNVKITEEGDKGNLDHIYIISAPDLSGAYKYQLRLGEEVFDAIFVEVASSDIIRTTLVDLFKTIGEIDTLSNPDIAYIDSLSLAITKYLESTSSLHQNQSDEDRSVHDIHWAIDQYLAGKRVRIANWVTGKYLAPLSVLSAPDAYPMLQPLMQDERNATNWEVCE